ncbi:MAG: CpaD family pilus assembly lipoprotein [Rhizobiaceae bacterium]|nr:CpaD family pilus assembly lipoprotein [Rhizobiaceae bacterium]
MTQAGLPKRAAIRPSVTAAVLITLSAALLSGCAKRHHITVGSVPDDYRTNHPIVVAERDQVLDVPVGMSTSKLSYGQRQVIAGHLAGYEKESGAALRILVPSGSANAGAASFVADEIADLARAQGVHSGLILISHYTVSQPETAAPVRVVYAAVTAGTGPCGRWPGDVLDTGENRHYANFGCAYQKNLAAQLDNPMDILGPRQRTEIDPENRSVAIETYKTRGVSEEFRTNSEVNY